MDRSERKDQRLSGKKATYVYCVVAAATRPRLSRMPAGLPGTGPARLLDAGDRLFVVVADAPVGRYNEAAIHRGLKDLDWVSRAAVAHEAVVESFIDQMAVLPMKLFTIFSSDARALDDIAGQRSNIDAFVKRVANHHEWGVRLVLDRAKVDRAAARIGKRTATGVAYLNRKKAQRDAATELAERARETVTTLYDRLERRARLAKRRAAGELPMEGGPLLLDAAFLVPRAREAGFQALAAREAETLARGGYRLTISGPWPPYTFVQD